MGRAVNMQQSAFLLIVKNGFLDRKFELYNYELHFETFTNNNLLIFFIVLVIIYLNYYFFYYLMFLFLLHLMIFLSISVD